MLKGIRIIEFEALGPAPFAGMLLADLGADVIVVHRKSGAQNPAKQDASLLDRGKRSIELDLKDPADIDTAKALVATADGLIEGLRPGVMERLGLGPEVAHQVNPKLVYGRMTGWGQTGPKAREAGHDLTYLALTGALHYAGAPGTPPFPPPTMLGDIGGGALYLVVGMLAGLLNAQRTGKGTVVDTAIIDGASHMMALLLSMGPQFDLARRGASLLDGPYWSRCYACSDERHIAVQCLEPQFHAIFLEKLGLAADPAFAAPYEPASWPEATTRLADLFAGQSSHHWAALFEGSDACVARVLTPLEAMEDPHAVERGIWQDGMPAPAPRFDGLSRRNSDIPRRGQHTDAIRRQMIERRST